MHVETAICTWNRADLLDKTLARLSQISVPKDVVWSVLVVNNCCTDHTDEVIHRHKSHLPITRLFESKPGLSNARNCAVSAAQGDLLLWTDDDVLVGEKWLEEYVRAARKEPEVAFFGGPIRPWFEEQPPLWIEQSIQLLEGPFAMLDFGVKPVELNANPNLPFGANYAVRTEIQRQYTYDPNLGRKQKEMLSGEESALLERIVQDGGIGRWVPTAPVQHFIPKERLTLEFAERYFVAHGRGLTKLGKSRWRGPRWWLNAWRKTLEWQYRLYESTGSHRNRIRIFRALCQLHGHMLETFGTAKPNNCATRMAA